MVKGVSRNHNTPPRPHNTQRPHTHNAHTQHTHTHTHTPTHNTPACLEDRGGGFLVWLVGRQRRRWTSNKTMDCLSLSLGRFVALSLLLAFFVTCCRLWRREFQHSKKKKKKKTKSRKNQGKKKRVCLFACAWFDVKFKWMHWAIWAGGETGQSMRRFHQTLLGSMLLYFGGVVLVLVR